MAANPPGSGRRAETARGGYAWRMRRTRTCNLCIPSTLPLARCLRPQGQCGGGCVPSEPVRQLRSKAAAPPVTAVCPLPRAWRNTTAIASARALRDSCVHRRFRPRCLKAELQAGPFAVPRLRGPRAGPLATPGRQGAASRVRWAAKPLWSAEGKGRHGNNPRRCDLRFVVTVRDMRCGARLTASHGAATPAGVARLGAGYRRRRFARPPVNGCEPSGFGRSAAANPPVRAEEQSHCPCAGSCPVPQLRVPHRLRLLPFGRLKCGMMDRVNAELQTGCRAWSRPVRRCRAASRRGAWRCPVSEQACSAMRTGIRTGRRSPARAAGWGMGRALPLAGNGMVRTCARWRHPAPSRPGAHERT